MLFFFACSAALPGWADTVPATQPASPTTHPSGTALLARILGAWERVIEPAEGDAPHTFTAHLRVVRAQGIPAQAAGAVCDIAFQSPSQLRIAAIVDGIPISAARNHNELWFDEPAKKFALIGRSGLPLFRATPGELDTTQLSPIMLPLSPIQRAMLPLLFRAEILPAQTVHGRLCDVLRLSPLPSVAASLHISSVSDASAVLWVNHDDLLPAKVRFDQADRIHVMVDVDEACLGEPWDAAKWNLKAGLEEKVETVPLAHLARFLKVAPGLLLDKVPALGPATGEHKVIATEGKGRLESIDGTQVLFLAGSPQEMGHQHGILLAKQINQVTDRILYGVGVASSFAKGAWFFGEIENAEGRMQRFIDPRYLSEMDAIADATGRRREESRLANFFPELFHCSGFSLFGKATKEGHMYHGRILDYMRGVGLEKNAVVIVHRPDYGHAWVNISYAGFVGTVTAMNEKGISVGEMGGRGEGQWDGKPMAELLREVMEKAGTLDEAVAVLRAGPRTCQYYYVVSDGKSKRAVGVAATHDQFLTIQPGEFNPLLPRPFDDAVLMSAGKRYQALADRVKSGYGSFDADTARALMDPPVCMGSNIQSVLFEPDTLDFWVANADSDSVASQARYTHYNLGKLLAAAVE